MLSIGWGWRIREAGGLQTRDFHECPTMRCDPTECLSAAALTTPVASILTEPSEPVQAPSQSLALHSSFQPALTLLAPKGPTQNNVKLGLLTIWTDRSKIGI